MSQEILKYTIDQPENSSRQYWKNIAETFTHKNEKKIMVIFKPSNILSINEVYEILDKLLTIGFIGVKIAFVIKALENKEFSKTSVLNKEISIKVFFSDAEAQSWLVRD